jgi:Cytochrome oxidase complex assembly protein 1
MWQFVGAVVVLLVVLAMFVFITLKDLHGLFQLVTGRVSMYRIARLLLAGGFFVAVGYPTILHFQHKSPLHLVIKPEAENRVRASTTARDALGESMSFGSEESFDEVLGESGSGEFTFPVNGNKASGDLKVTATKTAGKWSLGSITLTTKDKRVPIPVQ